MSPLCAYSKISAVLTVACFTLVCSSQTADAVHGVREHIASLKKRYDAGDSRVGTVSAQASGVGNPACDQMHCCTVDAQESCSISSLEKDTSSIVQPGGTTRCIFSTSTVYGFQVIPGDSDKLLLYFQGGGACWDEDVSELLSLLISFTMHHAVHVCSLMHHGC